MKQKIIILHFNMELGGAENSLLGLLDTSIMTVMTLTCSCMPMRAN